MHNLAHHRSAAASGAVFAVVLFVANGQGGSLAPWREVAASAALTLLVAFAAYLAVLVRLRSRGPVDDWLATTIVGTAAVGTAVKLASGAPDAALRAAGTPHGTQLASAVGAIGVALTTTALIPFALFCLAAGFGGLRTRILPRWISIGALAVGAALAVNGCFVSTENVPALLLMALWSIAASVHLVRTAGRTAGRTEVPTEPAIAAPPSDLSGRPSP